MNEYQLSFMEQGDLREAAKVLSIAMLNNPHHIGIFMGNGEKERLEVEKMFVELFNTLPGYVFLVKKDEEIIGVMRMKSCMGTTMTDSDLFEDEKNIEWRKYIWFQEWAKYDPLEQHWHLGPIGVLPGHQGRGIGSALMERFCQEVDACKASAFLETDSDKNVRFYEKFGFSVVAESDIFGVKSRYLLRASKA